MTGSNKLRRRRWWLWKRDPHCYFCGRLTVWGEHHKSSPRDDHATIEHLRSRLDPTRQDPNPEWKPRTVLCCWRCNNDRAKAEHEAKHDLMRERSIAGMLKAGINPYRPKPAWVVMAGEALIAAGLPNTGRWGKATGRLIQLFRMQKITWDELVGLLISDIKHSPQIASAGRRPPPSESRTQRTALPQGIGGGGVTIR